MRLVARQIAKLVRNAGGDEIRDDMDDVGVDTSRTAQRRRRFTSTVATALCSDKVRTAALKTVREHDRAQITLKQTEAVAAQYKKPQVAGAGDTASFPD